MEKLEGEEELILFKYSRIFLTLSYLKIHLALHFSNHEHPYKGISRESCQQKSKIMQLNYIGARRGFGDHQSFFLDEEVEKSGYVQRSLRVNDKCLP